MSSRINTHVIETKSRQIFESALTNYSDNDFCKGDLLFRAITERDYGIDGLVELFRHGEATGRFAMIQLKGTEKIIQKLQTADVVSCSGISKSNLSYCRQNNNPVILVYCSTADEKFYFIDLQSVYRDKIPQIGERESGTVRIPTDNNSDHLWLLIEIINSYYDKQESNYSIQSIREKQDDADYEDALTTIETYIFKHNQRPSDGEHKEVGEHGDIISIGLWKSGELIVGTEYEWLIRINKGDLIFKPDNPEDPYDSTADFEYEKLEQWGWRTILPFMNSMVFLENENAKRFYVVDMEVNGDVEQMVNIRTLEEFLLEKDPSFLKSISL